MLFSTFDDGRWSTGKPSPHLLEIQVGGRGQLTARTSFTRWKRCSKTPTLKSKGKAPAASPESTVGSRMPTLGIDTRLLKTLGPRQSYGTIGDQRSNGGPSSAYSQGSEIYRNGRLLFNVPEEVDDQDLEVLLDDEGLYLGSLCDRSDLSHQSDPADVRRAVLQGHTVTSFESTQSCPSHPSLFGSSSPSSHY